MDLNANVEKNWEAIIAYIWGLIALVGLYAEHQFAYDDGPIVRDLTAADNVRELALRELERLALEANPPKYSYRGVRGWIGHSSQSRLESPWKRRPLSLAPAALASSRVSTHLPPIFTAIDAAQPARFALRFRASKMRARDSP